MSNTNNNKKLKIATISLGAIAGLGVVGTATFGALWGISHNQPPEPPEPTDPTSLSVTSDKEAVQITTGTATISYNLEGPDGSDWTTTWEVEGGTLSGTDYVQGKTTAKSGTLTFAANSSEGLAKIRATNNTVTSLTQSVDINVINATAPTNITINGKSAEDARSCNLFPGDSAVLDATVAEGDSVDWILSDGAKATIENNILKINTDATARQEFTITAKSHVNPTAASQPYKIYVTDFIPAAMSSWWVEGKVTEFDRGQEIKVDGFQLVDTNGQTHASSSDEFKFFSLQALGEWMPFKTEKKADGFWYVIASSTHPSGASCSIRATYERGGITVSTTLQVSIKTTPPITPAVVTAPDTKDLDAGTWEHDGGYYYASASSGLFAIDGLDEAKRATISAKVFVDYYGVRIEQNPTITWTPETGTPTGFTFNIELSTSDGTLAVNNAHLTIMITQTIDGQTIILYQDSQWTVDVAPYTP